MHRPIEETCSCCCSAFRQDAGPTAPTDAHRGCRLPSTPADDDQLDSSRAWAPVRPWRAFILRARPSVEALRQRDQHQSGPVLSRPGPGVVARERRRSAAGRVVGEGLRRCRAARRGARRRADSPLEVHRTDGRSLSEHAAVQAARAACSEPRSPAGRRAGWLSSHAAAGDRRARASVSARSASLVASISGRGIEDRLRRLARGRLDRADVSARTSADRAQSIRLRVGATSPARRGAPCVPPAITGLEWHWRRARRRASCGPRGGIVCASRLVAVRPCDSGVHALRQIEPDGRGYIADRQQEAGSSSALTTATVAGLDRPGRAAIGDRQEQASDDDRVRRLVETDGRVAESLAVGAWSRWTPSMARATRRRPAAALAVRHGRSGTCGRSPATRAARANRGRSARRDGGARVRRSACPSGRPVCASPPKDVAGCYDPDTLTAALDTRDRSGRRVGRRSVAPMQARRSRRRPEPAAAFRLTMPGTARRALVERVRPITCTAALVTPVRASVVRNARLSSRAPRSGDGGGRVAAWSDRRPQTTLGVAGTTGVIAGMSMRSTWLVDLAAAAGAASGDARGRPATVTAATRKARPM